MFFKQYFLGCLSHASYLIGDDSSGRAVVVDPQRDVSGYLADAENHGLCIKRVVETHFHADFLSGHLELAAQTGAVISCGTSAHADFPIEVLHDGQRLSLGEVTLEVRATPGHTPESICLVVYERPTDTVPSGVLTGDTLFICDVGRPDLLASQGVTADELARQLYCADLAARLNESAETVLIDVRNPGELVDGMIEGAINIPLPQLLDALDDIDRRHPVVVYCGSGMRSSIAASVLTSAGYPDVSDLLGGYSAWRALIQSSRLKAG